jgi:SAM-dependent methyltransferase
VTRLERLAEIRRTATDLRPLGDETGRVLEIRFSRVPHRVVFALDRWPLEQAAVLDVGCSFGQALVHFGPGSVGVDNAPGALAFCRALGLDVREADVEDATRFDAVVPDGTFDFVWISDIVEHLDAPRVLLRRLGPKLKPDGRVILHISTLPENRVARALVRRLGMRPFDAQAHFQQFTVETTRHILARAGLRLTRVVVPVPQRLERASSLMRPAWAPRLFFEAIPDQNLALAAADAERRNKRPV